ncbi:hypothetical protein D3C78_1425480 [compost metagenome]
MQEADVPRALHRLELLVQRHLTGQQVAQAVGIAAKDRVFAGAVMRDQSLHIPLEELIGGVLEATQTGLRLDQMRLDPLGVIADEPRHLDTDQQARRKQHQP